MKTSDHGRSSWRIADALGLKIITSNILYLKKVLVSWFNALAIFVIPKYW
jgi:hypothetical protein